MRNEGIAVYCAGYYNATVLRGRPTFRYCLVPLLGVCCFLYTGYQVQGSRCKHRHAILLPALPTLTYSLQCARRGIFWICFRSHCLCSEGGLVVHMRSAVKMLSHMKPRMDMKKTETHQREKWGSIVVLVLISLWCNEKQYCSTLPKIKTFEARPKIVFLLSGPHLYGERLILRRNVFKWSDK